MNSFIISRVDYCNSILAGVPACQISHLQAIRNSAARLIQVASGTTTSQISSETDCTGYQFNIASVSSVQCLCTERYMASLLHTSPVSNNPSSSVATSSDPRLLLSTTWLFQQRKVSLEDALSLSPVHRPGTFAGHRRGCRVVGYL